MNLLQFDLDCFLCSCKNSDRYSKIVSVRININLNLYVLKLISIIKFTFFNIYYLSYFQRLNTCYRGQNSHKLVFTASRDSFITFIY